MTDGPKFDYFVVFAEMRTGSNLLEANLNEFEGLSCLGEVFNPAFIGQPNKAELLGIDMKTREATPHALLDAIRAQPHLTGFRYFNDHDPRILSDMVNDPRCGKIVLTRNPLDSYVSLKIAMATQQWKLGDVKTKRSAKVTFDPAEFEAHVTRLQQFQLRLQRMLQLSAQTAFYIAYEDANDLAVLNGLAAWLGVAARIAQPSTRLKRQNPEPIEEKLTNPEALRDGLARLDRFNLSRSPVFEPRRQGLFWTARACRTVPLIHLPLPGNGEAAILDWMAQIDGARAPDLQRDFTAEGLQDWLRLHPRHLAFTAVMHPLQRLHEVYRWQVLHGQRQNVRTFLNHVHGVVLPTRDMMESYGPEDHGKAFRAFLRFVHANLNNQTSMHTHPAWAPQCELIADISASMPLHAVLFPEDLAQMPARFAERLGTALPGFSPPEQNFRITLDSIYDPEIEELARAAHGLDYARLGFGNWR